jgi:hypothetical protein
MGMVSKRKGANCKEKNRRKRGKERKKWALTKSKPIDQA